MPDNQHNNKHNNQDISKLLNKIYKLQEHEKEERDILTEHLKRMNDLLEDLATSMITNVNVAKGQKLIPFQTTTTIPTVLLEQPSNPDDYPADGTVNIYAQNDSKPIQHMTLVNDGPGDIYFITAYARNEFSSKEGLLHPNDQRELFNVYEVRTRVTLPLTSYRLIEGVFRTGSFAPTTKANVEIRPTLQANEKLKLFSLIFDNKETIYDPITDVYKMTINVPVPVQTIDVRYNSIGFLNPLNRGQTAAFIDFETGQRMPFTIPSGHILEFFSFSSNMNTDTSIRSYVEVSPITLPGIYTLYNNFPMSFRGVPFQLQTNINQFSTELINPNGAPSTGTKIIVILTNDDPFNAAIGNAILVAILRRLR